jgi:beta-glucosidase
MRVAEYAAAAADRYRGRIYWYTPLNEPRINAWYCGRLGWWPPFLRSWKGFVAVLLGICRGIVETCHALHRVDPEIVLAHVDASDRFLPLDEGARELADFRQELVFLALDLVSGRVDEAHALYAWLLEHDADEDLLDSFRERPVELDLIGANLYPMFTLKHVQSVQNNKLRLKMKYADGSLASEICEMYYRRYQKPVWISETASAGSVRKREKWMRESIAAVRTSRMAGVPLMGYTWWPMFSLVAWAYRQQHRPVEDYLLHMGLWDLSEDGQLERQETNLVQMYRQYIERGHEDVGLLVTES